jgi:CDGSH-type Zn-finger protein
MELEGSFVSVSILMERIVDEGNYGTRRTTMAYQTKITALDNGPYLVKGPVLLVDAEGNEFRAERATVALCRCGGSMTKPLCDGTHSKIGFRAVQRAVREEVREGA